MKTPLEIFDPIAETNEWKAFEAYDHQIDRKIEVRQIKPEWMANDRRKKSIVAEAKALAGLNHGNIIRIYSIDEADGTIALERLKYLDRESPEITEWSSDRVWAVLTQLLNALEHLHRQGKVHGRVSLANIGLDEFGIAKLAGSAGYSLDSELPTLESHCRHQAPELIDSAEAGSPGFGSDIYCLGIAILELVLGPRFEKQFKSIGRANRSNPSAWIAWHASRERLPALGRILPETNPQLVSILERMVEKQVGNRYANAQEVLMQMGVSQPNASIPIGNSLETTPSAIDCSKTGSARIQIAPTLNARSSADEEDEDLVAKAWAYLSNHTSPKKLLTTSVAILLAGFFAWSMIPSKPKAAPTTTAIPATAAALEPTTSDTPKAEANTTPKAPDPFIVRIENKPAHHFKTVVKLDERPLTYSIDEESWSITPDDESDGEQGFEGNKSNYRLTIEAKGFEKYYEVVRLDRQKEVLVTLKPIEHKVSFTVSPKDAELLVDGKRIEFPLGSGNLKLTEGSHRVELRKEGYASIACSIEVDADKLNEFCWFLPVGREFNLDPEPIDSNLSDVQLMGYCEANGRMTAIVTVNKKEYTLTKSVGKPHAMEEEIELDEGGVVRLEDLDPKHSRARLSFSNYRPFNARVKVVGSPSVLTASNNFR